MSNTNSVVRKAKLSIAACLIAVVTGVHPSFAQDMTAGLILKEMPVRERTAYITGIVEGFAYARFRKDSAAAGAKDQVGMKCIYDWLYKDSNATLDRIEAAFRQHEQHFPSTLLAAMIKKECGE